MQLRCSGQLILSDQITSKLDQNFIQKLDCLIKNMIKDLFNICPLIVWSGPKQQRRTHRPVGGWNILLRYFISQSIFQLLLRFHQNQERSLTLDRCNHFEPPNRVQRCRRRRLHRDCKPPTRCWNITVIQLSDI